MLLTRRFHVSVLCSHVPVFRGQRASGLLILGGLLWFACCGVSTRAAAQETDDAPQETTVTAHEESGEARVEQVVVGFDGKYKLGHWTPVSVTFSGGTTGLRGALELVAPDGDGVLAAFSAGEDLTLDIRPRQRGAVTGYVRFGRANGQLGIRVVAQSGIVLEYWCRAGEVPTALSATRELFVTVGPSIGVADVLKNNLRASRHGMTSVHMEDASGLPDHWCGYEGVDVLVLTTAEAEVLDQVSERQFRAIELSLRMGGRLLWCVGGRSAEVFSPESKWSIFAPGRFERLQRLQDTTTLETYAGAMRRLDAAPGYSRETGVSAALYSELGGRVELSQTAAGGVRVPLLIRYPISFGQAMLVTLDLDQPPFREWAGRPRLVAGILGDIFESRAGHSSATGLGQVSHVGYDDMVGQLRGALDQFSGVTLVAFSWVAVLVGIYILLIGPGDYFFLRKIVGRMPFSWITFPLIIVLFTLLAWSLTGRVRDTKVRLNQIDVVDFDTRAEFGRATTWTHVYSPSTATYDFQLPRLESQIAGLESEAGLLAWQGLPGTGLGGMGNAATAAQFDEAYQIRTPGPTTDSSQGDIRKLPIPVAGTKSLIGRRWFGWPNHAESDLSVRYESNLLGGTLINPLPVTLTGCTVMYGDWVYRLKDDLEPGATIRLDDLPSPRVLEWQLTLRRVVEQEAISKRWDATRIDDPTRILEIMLFHQAAGGQSYTELSHRYQGYLDLSEQLKTGKAILMGRGRDPAPGLTLDGRSLDKEYDMRWTYYRVMFPVDLPPSRQAATR